MLGFLGFIVAWAAAIVGYKQTRSFVRERLRYVDGVHRTFVPLKIGVIATIATLPVAWVLPAITTASAFLFGTAVGLGVSAGRRDIRERRYLSA
jgi:hypothetical protein